MVPEHWKIILVGVGECENGDVVTRYGEVLGTWTLVDDVFYAFTPEGTTEQLFFDPFLGRLCEKVTAWHAEREAAT